MQAMSPAKRPFLLLAALLLMMTASTSMAKDDDSHGYLGVMLQSVSGSMAKALQLAEGQGILINKVVEGGPAAASGLEDGDVILEFNGKSIKSYRDLTKAVGKTAPGDQAKLLILHNGKRQTAQVEMGAAPAKRFAYAFDTDEDAPKVEFHGKGDHRGRGNVWFGDDDGEHKVIVMSDDGDDDFAWVDDDGDSKSFTMELLAKGQDRGFMGVELDDLNEQLGDYFGVSDGEGALISRVNDDSPAAKAGFRAGDVIVSVNGEEVDDSGEVHEAMADTKPEQEIEVKVVRKGKKKTMKVTLGEMPEGSYGPHMMHIDEDFDFDFPEGLKYKVRAMAPHGGHDLPGLHGRREVRVLRESDEDLSEVRDELDKLKEELQELKEQMKK